MKSHRLSRRALLQAAGGLGATAAVFGLSGCKKGAKGGACTDLSGLSEGEKKVREQLKYVDKSPVPAKNCSNCKLYKKPSGGSECGGCTLFKGPVSPTGYCSSWQPS